MIDDLAVRRHHRHRQRHLPKGMCRAAQAGIKGADDSLHAVQCAGGELAVLDVCLRSLQNALVHGIVVVSGRDDEVGPRDQAVVVHLVVVVERAARCLDLSRAFKSVDAGGCAHVRVEDVRIGKDVLDLLDAVEHFDEPRMVVEERALDRACRKLLELVSS